MARQGQATRAQRERRLQPRILMNCNRCSDSEPRAKPCKHNLAFRWSDNEHLQRGQSTKSRGFTLIDTTGAEHRLTLAEPGKQTNKQYRNWRAGWLTRRLGPKPAPPQSFSQETEGQADPESGVKLRWRDNMHLVGDSLTYVMEDPQDAAFDIKVLRFVEATGQEHLVKYGDATLLGRRIEEWRSRIISFHLGGFKGIFGNKRKAFANADLQTIVNITTLHRPADAAEFSFEHHAYQIQQLLLTNLDGEGRCRLELSGASFPDFLLTLAVEDRMVRNALSGLSWAGRQAGTEAPGRVPDSLVRQYVAECDPRQPFSEHLYRMWRRYCDYNLDMNLLLFRRHLRLHPALWDLLAGLMRTHPVSYRWGDTGKSVDANKRALDKATEHRS